MKPALILAPIIISISVLVILTIKVKMHPFFALTIAAFTFGILAGRPVPDIVDAFSSGFGSTVAGIGVVIAVGTVMGTLLEKSGAAETMAQTILKITGYKYAALGLAVTGYFVSITVFCDSAFVLLVPLARRLSRDTKTSMVTLAIALGMGLHATHILVPPTPGPMAVTGILTADLGLVIFLGMLVSIPVTLVGYYLGEYFGQKYYFLPEAAEEMAAKEGERQPNVVLSFLPVFLPILLMLLNTVTSIAPLEQYNFFTVFLAAVGQPITALLIGLFIAFITYISVQPEDKKVWTFEGEFGESLKTAGQIVLIVGAGGAFASVLKTSNLEDLVQVYFSNMTVGILFPFIIGAIFRTAIGSGTVGMITAASMLMPLLDAFGFNTLMGSVIAMLACASGAFMVFHGNDDFFWIITSTTCMKPEVAYKTLPVISVAQALTSLACTFFLYLIYY